ncbi:MAG: hypothetical protein INH41_23170 [Myxococcaceae bacterium]|jgi:hypothetical protein|nr:hypothetical protein [Myxococcaceae bacterium]MCA3015301.1 hypothetical protein [Myxococcaceae bacterium]
MTGSPRAIGISGLVGVVLNVVAVVALQPFTSPYSPADVPGWLASCVEYPVRTAVSAFAFTFGLVALAAFALGFALVRRSGAAVVAGAFIGFGALLDAAGTTAPLVALNTEPALGQAFLRFTLLLDATFNGCLGVGLIAACVATPDTRWRWLALAAGLLSLPVAFQWASPDAARLLALAGPAWLVWMTATSLQLLRSDAP